MNASYGVRKVVDTARFVGPFLLSVYLAAATNAGAKDVPSPLPPGGQCARLGDNEPWTDPEKFVWARVCQCGYADFEDDEEPPTCSQRVRIEKPWTASRILSSSFLETILLKDPYRSALTRRGVRIIGAHFDEVVDLQNGELQHQLWLGKSILDQGANFSGLKASGLVSLEGSTIWGDLNLNGAEVGGDLLLDGCALFGNVQLKSAIVHGELRLSGSVVGGKFDGTAMKVDHSLSLDSGAIFNMIDLTGAKSDGDFNLSGSTFNSSVDMTEAQIGGELSLEFNSDADKHSKAVWSADTVLTLRNAKADLIPNSSDIWPENIVLDGFTYRGLSSNGVSEGEAPMTDAVVARSDNFSPQAYEQLATVLQNEGETGRARDVLYALRKAERDHAQDPWRRAGLSVLDWFIGYGYYLERALGWAVVFWFVGGLVMFASGQYRRFGLGPLGSFVYSFDMLLPIIRLREGNYKIDVKGLPQFYFYFHKIMGYILASFLIAGLAGLAK